MADAENKKHENKKQQFIRENSKCFGVGYDCGKASLLGGSIPRDVPVAHMRMFARTNYEESGYKTLQAWNNLYTRWYDGSTVRTNYARTQGIEIPRGLKKFQRGFAFGFAVGAGFAKEDYGMAGKMLSTTYARQYFSDMDGRYRGAVSPCEREWLLQIQASAGVEASMQTKPEEPAAPAQAQAPAQARAGAAMELLALQGSANADAMVLDGVADAIDGMVLDEGGIEDGGIQEKQSPPAQARAGAAMELLALQGSANADAMVLDGVADEIDGMELDEGGIEDGGIQEKESPPGYLSRAIERDWGAIEDGCTWRWMKIMPTAEQKRVLEMDADNAEKGRLARNKLQRVREAAGRMTDGTTLSIGNSDGLDLHKCDSQVNAPAYALVLPLTRPILPSAHDVLAGAAATEAKDPCSISARLLS